MGGEGRLADDLVFLVRVGRDFVGQAAAVLADALGANITGVITSAIIAAIYVTVVPLL